MSAPVDASAWTPVCRLDAIDREAGVAALVGGEAVAVFRTHDDEVHAVGNFDPVARASVMSRGIVGTRGDVPFVASPLHKQAYDLRSGVCLDDAELRLGSWDAVVVDGSVHVGDRRT